MDEKLYAAFDQVRASQEQKELTLTFLLQVRNTKHRPTPIRRLATVAACLAILLVGAGGYWLYFIPTSVVSIDINPSLELGINRFDKVVSVDAYNGDGQALADSLDLRFLDFQTALEQAISNQNVTQQMEEGALLSITVVGKSQTQSDRLLAEAEACTAGRENVRCCHGDMDTLEQAHHMGLSFGKYQAFLHLQALDPTLTSEEAAGMTMREIQERIEELSGMAVSDGSNTHSYGQKHGWQNHH